MTRRFLQNFLSVSLLACLIAASAFAQKITGDVVGTVTDPSGAVVSDATVTAENPETGFKASAKTTSTGDYRLVNLAPGTYKLTATAKGFKTVVRDAVVAVATVTTSNFHMVVGAEGESITVEASAPLVETTENRLGTLLEARRVSDLPNSGRDFSNLLEGIPGVQRSPGGGFQSLNINGQRATATNFAVDGIPNNDRYYGESSLNQAAIAGTAATLVPLDAIQEFSVQSNPSAEYGVRGGSVVNVAMKSGTNTLHGTAFWTRHTDAFDAGNYFTGVTPFRLNQFEGTLGFPIKKDKSFFFASYTGFRIQSRFGATIDVPTPQEIADATLCVQTGTYPGADPDGIPNTGDESPCVNSLIGPGPGSDQIFGTADDGTVSSIGAALLSFIPTSDTGSLDVTARNTLNGDGFTMKFDHLFNDRHRISAKYIFGDSFGNQPPAPGVPESVGPLATGPSMWNSVAPSRAQQAGINYTWTISSNQVLESRLGYQRFSQRIGINNDINPLDLGINTGPLGSGPEDTENFGVPTMYYLGYFGNTSYGVIGGIQGYPIVTQPNASYDWQEHFIWTKGSHTIKIGGQYQNAYTKSRRDRSRSDLSMGYYGFYYCAYYALCDPFFDGATPSDHVQSLNQLLLGMASGSGRSFGVTPRRIYQHSVGVYIQDSWKVKPNFTLELGIRWDVAGALGEAENRGDNFLPGDPLADPVTGFVSLSDQPLYKKDANNLGPRVGFAWDLFSNGKTVLRGGYTLSYDVPNFGTIHAPQTFGNMFNGTRAGAFTQIPQGNFPIQIFATPGSNLVPGLGGTNAAGFDNPLCTVFVCLAPGVNIYG
ncbi:MAG: TonB-dependent receptor domain-containing protein, partial [Terriglobales bacterium]